MNEFVKQIFGYFTDKMAQTGQPLNTVEETIFRKAQNLLNVFPISCMSADDLESLGFDTSGLDASKLQRLAEKLGDVYVENYYWTGLETMAELYGISRRSMVERMRESNNNFLEGAEKTTACNVNGDFSKFNGLQKIMDTVCNNILNKVLNESGGEILLSCPNYDSWDDAWEREGHCYPSNYCPVSLRVLMQDGYMHEIYLTRVYRDKDTADIRYEGYDDEEGFIDQRWCPDDDLNQMAEMVKFIHFVLKDK